MACDLSRVAMFSHLMSIGALWFLWIIPKMWAALPGRDNHSHTDMSKPWQMGLDGCAGQKGAEWQFCKKGAGSYPVDRGRYFQTFWAPDPNKWPSPVPQTSSVLHWNINSLEVWGPSGPQLRVGDPSGLFTSSFVPFGRSGRVTYADGDLWRYRLRIFVTECSGRDCGSWIHRQIMMTKYNLITSQRQLSISGICVWPPSLPLSWRSFSS